MRGVLIPHAVYWTRLIGSIIEYIAGGQRILARRVVLAVPITVLQRADIVFSPPLPPRKQVNCGIEC